jgi:5-carboxymethyl-2-hydroxymuconate isomerase
MLIKTTGRVDLPHLMVDYSPNLEDRVNFAALCNVLRLATIETGVFPMPGVRVRAMRADHVSIADGDAAHGYIDISVRLRGGRDPGARKAATAHIFAAAKDFLNEVMSRQPIALSLEMRDIDPDLSPKYGTIRDHMNKNGRQ